MFQNNCELDKWLYWPSVFKTIKWENKVKEINLGSRQQEDKTPVFSVRVCV